MRVVRVPLSPVQVLDRLEYALVLLDGGDAVGGRRVVRDVVQRLETVKAESRG